MRYFNSKSCFRVIKQKLKDQFFETLYDDPYGLNYRSVFYITLASSSKKDNSSLAPFHTSTTVFAGRVMFRSRTIIEEQLVFYK